MISVVTCGLGSVIGLIEGIIYLTKTDEEFVELYIENKRAGSNSLPRQPQRSWTCYPTVSVHLMGLVTGD